MDCHESSALTSFGLHISSCLSPTTPFIQEVQASCSLYYILFRSAIMRGQSFLLPWLLSFTAIQCAPTGNDAPGIGVELEARGFVLENKGEAAMNTRSDDDIAKVKGAVLLAPDYQSNKRYAYGGVTCGQFWELVSDRYESSLCDFSANVFAVSCHTYIRTMEKWGHWLCSSSSCYHAFKIPC